MSISSSKSLLRDVVIAAAVAALIALVASPTDPALAAWPVHPAWIVAQVLAARYGASGLYGVPAVLLGGQLASWLGGLHGIAMLARLERPGDLAALIAIAIIAVIGTIQHNRRALLEVRLAEVEHRARTAEVAVDKLTDASIALRDRCDRSQTSLAVIADMAIHIGDGDPKHAGDAALALAMARTGARGGFVQLLEHGRLRFVCSRGIWSADRAAPPTVFRDVVATAALESARPVAAHELAHASMDDSDLAAPLVNSHGIAVGVLALRGLSYHALVPEARAELATVARWAGRAFGRDSRREPGPAAGLGAVHAAT
jgi:hypothetical protein